MAVVCRTGNRYRRSPDAWWCAPRPRLSPRPARRTGGPGRCRVRCCARSASAPTHTRPASIEGSTSGRPRVSRWSVRRAAQCPLPGQCRPAAGHSRFGLPAATPRRCFTSARWPSAAARRCPKETSWARSGRAACLSCPCRTCTSACAAPLTRRATSTSFSCCLRPRPIRPQLRPNPSPHRLQLRLQLRRSRLRLRLRLLHPLRPPTRRLFLLPHEARRPRGVVMRPPTCAECRIRSRSGRWQLRCRPTGLLLRTRAVRRRRSPASRLRLGVHRDVRARSCGALLLEPPRDWPASRGQGGPPPLDPPRS